MESRDGFWDDVEGGLGGVADAHSHSPGSASNLRSPHDWEVISMYTDDMAVEDGVLVDLAALGVKAEYGGLVVNRMTSHLFFALRNMTASMHETVEDPVLAAELEATLRTKLIFAHDSEGDGVIVTLPSGSETDPIWLVQNEVGGYTAMFSSDY